jgi:hypothetical protein
LLTPFSRPGIPSIPSVTVHLSIRRADEAIAALIVKLA